MLMISLIKTFRNYRWRLYLSEYYHRWWQVLLLLHFCLLLANLVFIFKILWKIVLRNFLNRFGLVLLIDFLVFDVFDSSPNVSSMSLSTFCVFYPLAKLIWRRTRLCYFNPSRSLCLIITEAAWEGATPRYEVETYTRHTSCQKMKIDDAINLVTWLGYNLQTRNKMKGSYPIPGSVATILISNLVRYFRMTKEFHLWQHQGSHMTWMHLQTG